MTQFYFVASDDPAAIEEIKKWINWLGLQSPAGIIGVVFIVLFVWGVFYKESFERFTLFLTFFFRFFKWGRKRKVKKQFEIEISDTVNRLTEEIGNGIFTHKPEITWVTETTREEFIRDNKVVIRLNYHDDQNKTFALASLGYVRQSFLPTSKQYVPEEIFETASLIVTRRILENYSRDALNFLHIDILQPLFKSNPEIKKKFDELIALDNQSLFFQIFVPELYEMGLRLYPRTYDSKMLQDGIENLIEFLHAIAIRDYEEKVPLDHSSVLFKLKIVILARVDTLYNLGLTPYTKRIEEALSQGYENIYVLAHTGKRRDALKLVKRFENHPRVNKTEVRKGKVYTPHSTQPKDCVCIVIKAGNEKSSNLVTEVS